MAIEKRSTQVLIIGGGVTGTGLARDLAQRGVQSILVEQKDINAGASGSNHGLLHSGARYVSNDLISANQCKKENELLKRLAPGFIESTGGLFVAIEGDDENYIADFPGLCEKAEISCKKLDVDAAKEIEPTLSDQIIAAYEVEDATIDPFGLSLANISEAIDKGSSLLLHSKVTSFKLLKGKIESVTVENLKNGHLIEIFPEQVVSASGAWTKEVAELAGISVETICSKGTLLVTNSRLTQKVINRLRPAADADIAVPGGTVSILGTTSARVDTLEDYRPTVEEVDYIIDEMAPMMPVLETTRYIRAFAGVRPLIMNGAQGGNDRSASREFELIDHSNDGVQNFTTITGGKLTTFRYMAEKAADMICEKLSVSAPCLTKELPLKSILPGNLTFPGMSPKVWFRQNSKDDLLLCECEMVSKQMIDNILAEVERQPEITDLKAIGLRSRVGKGTCQGSFCSVRLIAHLYDRYSLNVAEGKDSLKEFIQERWIGQHSVLWGNQLAQAELSEAMHCGLFSLEI